MVTPEFKLIFLYKSAGLFPISQRFGNAFKSTGFMPKPLITKLLVSLLNLQMNGGNVVYEWEQGIKQILAFEFSGENGLL